MPFFKQGFQSVYYKGTMPGFVTVKTYFFWNNSLCLNKQMHKNGAFVLQKKCNSTEQCWFNKNSSVAHRFYVFLTLRQVKVAKEWEKTASSPTPFGGGA